MLFPSYFCMFFMKIKHLEKMLVNIYNSIIRSKDSMSNMSLPIISVNVFDLIFVSYVLQC